MNKPIYNITPFTLLDYPDKTACILWFAGCNMRCVYCYNPDIVLGKGKITTREVEVFLKSRVGLLDGVIFSGGECTLHPEIIEIAHIVKTMNMLVKIDTNGSKPEVIRKMVQLGLVDYVALDCKAPPSKFQAITGTELFTEFTRTAEFLIKGEIPFEIRSTIHTQLLLQEDIEWMSLFLRELGYKETYFLQHFQNDVPTLKPLARSHVHSFFSEFKSSEWKITCRNV